MSIMRKTLFVLLALALCLALLSVGALAEGEEIASGVCGEDLVWTLDDAGVLTISGTGAMTDYGYMGSPWIDHVWEEILSVVIEPGVTHIGTHAFGYCGAMESIDIPEGVESIGYDAFYECGKLRGLDLPASLTEMDSGAFWDCDSLQYLRVSEDNPVFSSVDGVLLNKEQTQIIISPPEKPGLTRSPRA